VWKTIQGSAVIGLVWSNSVWAWTPNPYVPVALGFLLAYGLTYIGEWWWHWRRGLPMPGHRRISLR
jgi:hypothetical protein